MRHELPKGVDIGQPEKNPGILSEPIVDPVPREIPREVPKIKPKPIRVPKREPVPA
jgi:hypothetical protein